MKHAVTADSRSRVATRHFLRLVIAGALAVLALTFSPARGFAAGPCGPPIVNPIACENAQPGADPADWQVDGAGDPALQGFATQMSVNVGQTISFKIKSDTANYHVDIYRLGYYGGDGARLMQGSISHTNPTQPACVVDTNANPNLDTGLIDCGNWSVTASWAVPSTAVSGVYVAHLSRNDGTGDSQIIFVVRNDASHSDLLVQTSDETWQAYNDYGGNSLYTCSVQCPPGDPLGYKGAFKVSYNRPLDTAASSPRSDFFSGGEYPMIRFLEENGYDVSYLSSVDVQAHGSLLLDHNVFISSGHDEYWSATQRASMEAARNAGVNEAFFTANEGFWKTRWEPSIDGSSTPNRTVVSYKDTHFNAPTDPVEWTGTWRDPRFAPASQTPENSLTGQSFVVNSGSAAIQVPAAYGKFRLWRDTPAVNGAVTLGSETLGYEWDEDPDNGFRPPGEIRLSSTTVSGLEVFTDYGSTTVLGPSKTHNLTMYRAPSGALVFGAGTVQWAWGLDALNGGAIPVNTTMQQATVNLFADMGAQPATLLPNLHAETMSTDHTPPTSTFTSPPTSVADGTKVTLTGTATDSGGGLVAGIEVSTDGGSTWHPATSGTSSWTYAWTAHGNPTTNIRVRATDDSGNIETPGPGITVAVTCPCSIWGTSVTPINPTTDDPSSVEVGVKFRTDVFGAASGIRFYKAVTNTGTHTGSLWTVDGQRLAQATFTGETLSGWQNVTFGSPVLLMPNTTYVASYFSPAGHYVATSDYFWRQPAPGPNGGATLDSPPLHALRNSGTTTNGVYSYGSASSFPQSSFNASNYWVDVNFTPIPAPSQVTGVTAVAGGKTSANVTWSVPAGNGTPTTYTITPYVGSTAQTPMPITGSPPATTATVSGLTNGTTYTFKVRASNPTGTGPDSASSNAVTPLTSVEPAVPTNASAVLGSQSARLSWTAPSSDGDSPITGYVVTPYVGATAQPTFAVSGAVTAATVTGLTNGTSYTFQVAAQNLAGTSPQSQSTNAVIPQQTIFDFATPTTVDGGDNSSVELGVKFKADYNGTITGLRFYKAAANGGLHVGTLWSSTGTQLARATFTNETASGWQVVYFSAPVSVTAGTTYVASYFAPIGHYSITLGGLTHGADNGTLHALASGVSANGVFLYANQPTFPVNSDNDAEYGIDVMFALPVPGQVTNVAAAAGGPTSAVVSWSAPASGGPALTYKVTPYIGTTAQTPKTVSAPATSMRISALTTGTTYTFKVESVNPNGSGPVSTASNAVTPLVPVVPSPPTGVSATPTSASALVKWNAPDSDGESAVTGYTITPYIGASAQTATQVGAGSTSATVSGLANGSAYTFKVSAKNAVGTGTASAASAAITPQAMLFDLQTPSTLDGGDVNSVVLGMKFRSDVDGSVTGLRFYKAAANTGTHVGSLWAPDGTLLAQATFTNETASGWQTVQFSSPVLVNAGATYTASYLAPNGHYSVSVGGFATAVSNPPLNALVDSTSANGLYAYSSTSVRPTSSWNAANYYVDVTFLQDPPPGQVTGVTATAGQASATISWTAPATGGRPASYEVTPYIGTTAQTPKTVTAPTTTTTISGLTAGSAYTFKVRAINPAGAGTASAASNSVTPTPPAVPNAPTGAAAEAASGSARVSWTAPGFDGGSTVTGYTITPYIGATAQTATQAGASATSVTVTGLATGTAYTFKVSAKNAVGTGAASAASNAVTPQAMLFDLQTPATLDSGDTGSVALGVEFTVDVDGSLTGLRFYKSTANTGTHVGSLWTAGGTLLASATFTNETASGWQTVQFATPVSIDHGTTYIASYFAANGHYSKSGSLFTSPVDNAPLHAPATVANGNGLYLYSGTNARPTDSWNASDYYVDVTFVPDMPPGTVTGVTATADYGSANVSWSAPATGGRTTSYQVTPYIGATAQTPQTVTGNPPAVTTTISGLSSANQYTFKVKAINDAGSGPLSAASNAITPEMSIFGTAAPAIPDSGDANSVALGVKFRSDVAGTVTGVRFYKEASNTGTHVGTLYASDGTLLAQATFTGETGAGWQAVKFATPVSITPGTVYVASYLAPNGHYSITPAAFNSAFDNSPLHVLADSTSPNGVYAYSGTPVLPSNGFNATNYWVDVSFAPGGGS
jgi:hypothetical protein